MLRIQKQAGKSVAGHVTTLSLSWLNARFCAVAVHRGAVVGAWENPEPVEGTNHFEDLLGQAVLRTGYTGTNVSLLLAHPRLAQQVVDLPPVKGETLNKLVQRQAKQQKLFTTEAAWAYQNLPATKENQRIILHLFPRILLNQLVDACKKHHLHLTAVFPASALLQHQISQVTADKDQTVLVAANTHGSVTMVVGQFDGQTLVARTLQGEWSGGDRLLVDLNRTIVYANQQFGVMVGRTYLFGQGAEERVNALSHVQPPIDLSPVEYSSLYWATEAVQLQAGSHPNLISPELLQAPKRYGFAKAIAALTILLLVSTLGFSVWSLLQARTEAATIKTLNEQLTRQRARLAELTKRSTELKQQSGLAKSILDGQTGPVPAWLLAFLGEATPPDLVITNLVVKRDADLWKVRIAGTSQSAPGNFTPENTNKAVAQFKERLAGPPFHIRFIGNPDETSAALDPSVLKAGRPQGTSFLEWVSQVAARSTNNLVGFRKGNVAPTVAAAPVFQIEGVMR